MGTDAGALLKSLGGARAAAARGAGSVRGGGGAGAVEGTGGTAPPGGFERLLAGARRGEGATGLAVANPRGAGVTLSAGQLQRLSAAADKAEAAGVTQALVLIDGQALRLDVQGRRVLGAADTAAAVVTGIDGVVTVPGEAEGGGGATVAVLPEAGLGGAGELAGTLERLAAAARLAGRGPAGAG